MQNLLEVVKLVKVHNGAAAGTTVQTTNAVDTAGYDGIAYIADLGTVTDASVIQLTPLFVSTSTTTGGTAVTNATTAALTASTSSNTLIASDVLKGTARYSYATLTRTAQNAVLNTIIAVLYRAKTSVPITKDTTVAAQKIGGAI